MLYVQSMQSLGRHPKTKRLARKLGCSIVTAVGHLQFLWWWSLDYAENGDLSDYTAEDIADACLWEGEPEVCLNALIESGFIDGKPGDDMELHDWDDYAGVLIDERDRNRRKQKAYRERRKQETLQAQNTEEKARDGNVTVTKSEAPVTYSVNKTKQNKAEQNVTEEESRIAPPPPQEPEPEPQEPPPAEQVRAVPKIPAPGLASMPEAARQKLAIQGLVEAAACRLLGRNKLTAAQQKACNGYCASYGSKTTAEIVDHAEMQTATHTGGESLEYFFQVMRRQIDQPGQNRPQPRQSAQGPPGPNLKGDVPPSRQYAWERDQSGDWLLVTKRNPRTEKFAYGLGALMEAQFENDRRWDDYEHALRQKAKGVAPT